MIAIDQPRRGSNGPLCRESLPYPYFALVYCIGLSVAASLRFAIIIPLIVIGYSVMTGLLLKWVVDLSRNPPANRGVNAAKKWT